MRTDRYRARLRHHPHRRVRRHTYDLSRERWHEKDE